MTKVAGIGSSQDSGFRSTCRPFPFWFLLYDIFNTAWVAAHQLWPRAPFHGRLLDDANLFSYALRKMKSTNALSMTRLTTKGQVVIPKAIRGRLRLKPGTRLRVETDGKRVTLDPIRGSSVLAWLDEISGSLEHGDPLSDLEAEHRAEVERDARRRS